MAKTPHKILLYERALSQWKEAGYPHPGDWPDKTSHRVNPYTDLWVISSLRNGFLSNGKRGLFLRSKTLISFWEMVSISGSKISAVMFSLESFYLASQHRVHVQGPDSYISPVDKEELLKALEIVEQVSVLTFYTPPPVPPAL